MTLPAKRAVVACLGSSTTAAKGSYDWIGDLRGRPENAALTFLNFGVGGDLAYNALARVPEVLRARPDSVVVLIGGNDVLTAASPKLRRFLGRWKRFPQEPSAAWFEENLRKIIAELRRTPAVVALSSLGPIGEDPAGASPFQARLNELACDYTAIIRRVATEERTAYIPFYECFSAAIAAESGRALDEMHIASMYRDVFRLLLMHWSVDQVAEHNGWRFHTDGIHLNSCGGKLLADAVQQFLRFYHYAASPRA